MPFEKSKALFFTGISSISHQFTLSGTHFFSDGTISFKEEYTSMNMKRLALIGVLALVVIGCIAAAGCTSTSSTANTGTDDQIAGIWISEDGVIVFLNDNTGTIFTVSNDSAELLKEFTWKKNSDGTYAVVKSGADGSLKVTLDAVKGKITLETGEIFSKMASDASGSWTEILDTLPEGSFKWFN